MTEKKLTRAVAQIKEVLSGDADFLKAGGGPEGARHRAGYMSLRRRSRAASLGMMKSERTDIQEDIQVKHKIHSRKPLDSN